MEGSRSNDGTTVGLLARLLDILREENVFDSGNEPVIRFVQPEQLKVSGARTRSGGTLR